MAAAETTPAPEAGATGIGDLSAAMPLTRLLGVEFLENRAEMVRARLLWREDLCTGGGILHGGALMALADSTGAACAVLNLPAGAQGTATIESKTNFFRGVRGGSVEARSTPLHVGRTTIVVETDVLDEQERRVARVTQTQAVLGAP